MNTENQPTPSEHTTGHVLAYAGGCTSRHDAGGDPSNADEWSYPYTNEGSGKKYQSYMLDFMNWFYSQLCEPYDINKTFTRNKLLDIKPVDIHDWLAVKCFERADYNVDIEHRPTLARASMLQFMKKAVNFFMPNSCP